MRPSVIYQFLSPLKMMEKQHLQMYKLHEALCKPWAPWERVFDEATRMPVETKPEEPEVDYCKNKIVAKLNLKNYRPEDITVKVTGNNVTVEGKREEKDPNKGQICSSFVKNYVLPKGHDALKLESTLSLDGVLTITAPKIKGEIKEEPVRSIPIRRTGKLATDEKNCAKEE